MKTYFFILLFSAFAFATFAQQDPVERTKERAKQKTNNRIDRKVDQKIDEGLDAIEGLFKRKKKKKKKANSSSDSNSEERQENDDSSDNNAQKGQNILNQMFGEKGVVRETYSFSGNFLMRVEAFKKNGKKESDAYMRYYNAIDPDIMAMEVLAVDKDGKMGNATGKSIFDAKNQTMISIIEDSKQAVAMKMPNIEQFEEAKENENKETVDSNVKITRTGRTKTILGYTCTETIIETEDNKTVAWTTKEVKLSQFKAFAGMMMQKKEHQERIYALPFEFLMESETTDKKSGEKVKMTVTELNLNQGSTIYMSNYQLLEMPKFGAN